MASESVAPPPTASNQQFTELTDYIYPPLSTLDYSLPSVKLAVIAAYTLTSLAIYVTTLIIFTLASPLYRKLGLKEKVFWNLSVVRSCFGLFCIVVGLWAIFGHTVLQEDLVRATSPTSHLATCVAVGFFAFECLALTASDLRFKTFSAMLQIHHWISLIGFVTVVVTDAGHGFGCQGLMLEMSTPFSGVCWTLLKAGKEHSLLWKANQFLLVHTFHLRNVVEVLLWYYSYQQRDNVWAHMPWLLFVTMYGQLLLVTFFMTPFWTMKKTRQMVCPVDWNFESENVRLRGQGQNRANNHGGMLYEVHENGYTGLNGDGRIKEE